MYSINQDPSAFVLNLNQTNTYASGTNGFAKDQVNTMGNNRYLEFIGSSNKCSTSHSNRLLEGSYKKSHKHRRKRDHDSNGQRSAKSYKNHGEEHESSSKSMKTGGTLGELVEEVKRKVKRSRTSSTRTDKRSKHEIEQNNQEEDNTEFNSDTKDIDDVPHLTAKDLEENIVLDGYDFDETTMKVKELDSSIKEFESCSEYVASDQNIFSSQDGHRNVSNFIQTVIRSISISKESQPIVPRPPTPSFHHKCKCGHDDASSSSSDDEDEGAEQGDSRRTHDKKRNMDLLREEVERKRQHPCALSENICFNEKNMSNDGPVCRCSARARQEGLRHGIFKGESLVDPCVPQSNNISRLHHYVLRINSNLISSGQKRSEIFSNGQIYVFEGYSVFFHRPLPDVFPAMPSSRWTTDIDFEFVKEPSPTLFTVEELEVYYQYVFVDLLDFLDLTRFPNEDKSGCPMFHLMPRFINRSYNTSKILPMSLVLQHLHQSYEPISLHKNIKSTSTDDSFCSFIKQHKGELMSCPDKKPSSIRADGFHQDPRTGAISVIHYATKPTSYMNVHNPELQHLNKKLNKMRHLLGIKRNATPDEKTELDSMQVKYDDLKAKNNQLRNCTVYLPSQLFHCTGLFPDIVPHCLIFIIAAQHVRYHWSLENLEMRIQHKFRNRSLLELALTHPSFKHNYGTTADHAKNTLSNCAYKRKFASVEDKKDKKRGINRLVEIMSMSGVNKCSLSPITHNERLEYLGDAVVEMVVSSRLYFLLSRHNEGGLATYRSAMVQNRNLAALAQNLGLQHWLLFAHGPDLCHESDFRHALANSFEALMAAIFLDSNIDECDRIFSDAMFGQSEDALHRWINVPDDELRCDEYKDGDRHLIPDFEYLQKLTKLEESIGFRFKHIRLLAKAFTRRNVPYNCISKGNNQRLEWLGDTVLQLIVSDYLYKHFPYHHEGHLSLLRTCIVSNKTQAVICDDLSLTDYVVKPLSQKDTKLRVKDKADLVEAFIGALYVDGGWDVCCTFIRVCFLPRLKLHIDSNKWNDPKSQLQQACLSLRSADSKEPEIPFYRVISIEGPSNSRKYKVAVYFREKRLAEGEGGNLHSAEMEAARQALLECKDLFPQLNRRQKNNRDTPTRFKNDTQNQIRPSHIPSLFSACLQPNPFSRHIYGVPTAIWPSPTMPLLTVGPSYPPFSVTPFPTHNIVPFRHPINRLS